MTKKLVLLLNADSLIVSMFTNKSMSIIPFTTGQAVPPATIETCDLIVFCGGTDVSPSLYDRNLKPETDDPDSKRDVWEYSIFNRALKHGVSVLGICRGFQFINVMLGGLLVQHDKSKVHLKGHSLLFKDGSVLDNIPANHHQIVILPQASASLKVDVLASFNDDPELVLYEVPSWDFKALGCQPHPEWTATFSTFKEYIFKLIKEEL